MQHDTGELTDRNAILVALFNFIILLILPSKYGAVKDAFSKHFLIIILQSYCAEIKKENVLTFLFWKVYRFQNSKC